MAVALLPGGVPDRYRARLAEYPIETAVLLSGDASEKQTLADLAANDDLILVASSKALVASREKLRCRISLLLQEPYAIKPRFHRFCRLYAWQYHKILTHSTSILSTIKNSRFVPHGGTLINLNNTRKIEKTDRVSLIASPKKSTTGHKLRHRIAKWSVKNAPDLALFGGSYNPVEDKSDAHSPYLFSVVIENSRSAGYFTEKLIDSLLTLSLPIYWGAPDIAHFFDLRGMICCSSEKDIKNAVSCVSIDDYTKCLPYLMENQRRASLYTGFYANAVKALNDDAQTVNVI